MSKRPSPRQPKRGGGPPRDRNKEPDTNDLGKADEMKRRVKRAVASRKPGAADHHSGRRGGRPTGGGPREPRPQLGIMPTTLWEYPSQHYDDSFGRKMQGDKGYVGATPSWVIWQALSRYTKPGERVIDPMCGSGTTLDVAADLGRKARGFDLNPQRDAIELADARDLPLEASSVDFVFIDPPYSTHVDYSDDPRCIGKLDAGEAAPNAGAPGVRVGEAYYEAMEEVFCEAHRVLRPDRLMAVYVSDSWRKKRARGRPRATRRPEGVFMPIAFELFDILRDYFEPVDWITVSRKNTKLERGEWRKAAVEENFYLRGYNHMLLMYKQ